MSGTLFACEDPAVWREVEAQYWVVVEAKSLKGKKSGKLLTLDRWFQLELPAAIAKRPDRCVTLPELVKLMEWKLTRGKFRPRLQQVVASNPEQEVEWCSRKAFALLPDVQAAITELSSLKALGPATASAVLAAGAPEHAAFLADEAVESVPELGPVQYTAKYYALYLSKVTERTKALNKADSQRDWTPHRVELCLWAWAVANQLQLPLVMDVNPKPSLNDTSDSDTNHRPAKKLKTK